MIKTVAVVAVLVFATNLSIAEPLVSTLLVNDNRIVDVSGNYTFTTGEVSCNINLVQTPDGTVGFGAYVIGAGAAKSFITSGQLKVTDDEVRWNVQASQDGFTIKFKASAHPAISNQFTVEGSLKGTALDVLFSGNITPADPGRGLTITRTTLNGEPAYQFTTPFLSEVGFLKITGKNRKSRIEAKESFIKATFEGSIDKNQGFFIWTSGPSPSSLKFGKLKYTVDPSKLLVSLLNSKNE